MTGGVGFLHLFIQDGFQFHGGLGMKSVGVAEIGNGCHSIEQASGCGCKRSVYLLVDTAEQ